jgi:hypothetical protein
MTTTIIVHEVRYITAPGCSVCEKPLPRNSVKLLVRSTTKDGLGFHVGRFCSVKCFLKFVSKKAKAGQATIRGWTFGEKGRGR